MPVRSYWVIVDGTTPTAFRARDREVLVPTLRQLQRTQPGASLQWFERNRLWPSPEEALAAATRQRETRERRGKDWRPGGEHRDPKARYTLTRDQKRARWKTNARKRRVDAEPGGDAGRTPPGRPRPPRPPRDSRGPRRAGGPGGKPRK